MESMKWLLINYNNKNKLIKSSHLKRNINNKKNIYLNSINNSINYTVLRDYYK